ncbi:hypothetical protein ACFLYO_09725, partial [Chloroflexota bacterium]
MVMTVLDTKNTKIYLVDDGVGYDRGKPHDIIADANIGLGDYTESLGSLTRHYDIDPTTLDWRAIGITRDKPEAITFPLTMHRRAWNKLERYGANDKLAILLQHMQGGDPTAPLDYRLIEVFTDCYINDRAYSRSKTDGQESQEFITLTANINAENVVRIYKDPAAMQITYGITGPDDVDITAAAVAYDGTVYLVTALDDTPTNPYLLVGTPQRGGGITWASQVLTDLSAGVDAVIVMGDALLIASGTTISRAERADLTTWTDTTATGAINALVALDASSA